MKTVLELLARGVTVQEAAILIICNVKPRTRAEIAKLVNKTPNAIGQTCSQLERKELIEASIIPSKSCTKGPIVLTEKGKEIAKLP